MAGAGFKTFAAGEVLAAADVNTFLMQQTLMVFADTTARDAAITAPSEGMFTYLSDVNLLTFYDGAAWQEFTSGGGGVTVSATAPVDPDDGALWWDSDDGKMFIYYNDGTSSQWVDAAGPSVAVQSTAPTGYEGQLWLDDTDGSMYVYYTDPGGGASSWIGAVSRSGGILQVVSTAKTDTFSTTSASYVDVTGLSVSITPRSTSSKILVIVDANVGNASGFSVVGQLVRDGSAIYIGDSSGQANQQRASFMSYESNGTHIDTKVISYLDSPSTTSTITYGLQINRGNGSTAYVNRSASDEAQVYSARVASSITAIEVAG